MYTTLKLWWKIILCLHHIFLQLHLTYLSDKAGLLTSIKGSKLLQLNWLNRKRNDETHFDLPVANIGSFCSSDNVNVVDVVGVVEVDDVEVDDGD